MTVTYKGMDKEFNYRVAEINFDEDKEFEIVERVAFFMNKVKGYTVDIVTESYAMCEVENLDEFKDFAREWRAGVKMMYL